MKKGHAARCRPQMDRPTSSSSLPPFSTQYLKAVEKHLEPKYVERSLTGGTPKQPNRKRPAPTDKTPFDAEGQETQYERERAKWHGRRPYVKKMCFDSLKHSFYDNTLPAIPEVPEEVWINENFYKLKSPFHTRAYKINTCYATMFDKLNYQEKKERSYNLRYAYAHVASNRKYVFVFCPMCFQTFLFSPFTSESTPQCCGDFALFCQSCFKAHLIYQLSVSGFPSCFCGSAFRPTEEGWIRLVHCRYNVYSAETEMFEHLRDFPIPHPPDPLLPSQFELSWERPDPLPSRSKT